MIPNTQPVLNNATVAIRYIPAPAISETWDKFYNGPNAGKIDVEAARREMPWLIGEAKSVTIRVSPEPVV